VKKAGGNECPQGKHYMYSDISLSAYRINNAIYGKP